MRNLFFVFLLFVSVLEAQINFCELPSGMNYCEELKKEIIPGYTNKEQENYQGCFDDIKEYVSLLEEFEKDSLSYTIIGYIANKIKSSKCDKKEEISILLKNTIEISELLNEKNDYSEETEGLVLQILKKKRKPAKKNQGATNKPTQNNETLMKVLNFKVFSALFLFTSLIFAFFFFKERNKNSKLNDLNNKVKSMKVRGQSDREKISELSTTVAKRERDNLKLESKLKKLEQTKTTQLEEVKIIEQAKQENEYHFEQIEQPTIIKVGYFSTPNKEGRYFSVKDLKDYIQQYSFYEFRQLNDTEGTFRLIDDPAIQKRAIRSYDRVVAPVCMEENLFNPDAKKIEIIKDGELKLEGDKWKVVLGKECVIRYV